LLRWLSVSVLVSSLVPGIALADEPSLVDRMQAHLDADFMKPLAAHDNDVSQFSRMRMPPRERRLRMTSTTPVVDQAGQAFLTFTVDGRAGKKGAWHENDFVGCVYVDKGDIFVKTDGYRPASVMLGVAGDIVPNVCKAATPPRA
jgi:hypothetical protein